MWMWINIITNKGGSSPSSPVPPGPRPGLSPGRGWSRHLYSGETGSSVRWIMTRTASNNDTLSLLTASPLTRSQTTLCPTPPPPPGPAPRTVASIFHLELCNEQYLCQVSGLQIDETLSLACKKFMRRPELDVACSVMISSRSHCHQHRVTTRPDTFYPGSSVIFRWDEMILALKTSEILMSGASRWVTTPPPVPPHRSHTGDTTGTRPWCRHTGTFRTL